MTAEPEKQLKTEENEGFGPISSQEPGFGASDFANRLDIHVSKLRRWSIELEQRGYKIMRDPGNKRIYLQSDVPTFRKLREFIEERKMSVEDAYKAVSGMFRDYRHRLQMEPSTPRGVSQDEVVTMTKSDFEELVKVFGEQAQKAAEVAAERAAAETEKRFLDVLTNRDKLLVESLKQGMENQRMLLETTATKEEETKKGFFARLFK